MNGMYSPRIALGQDLAGEREVRAVGRRPGGVRRRPVGLEDRCVQEQIISQRDGSQAAGYIKAVQIAMPPAAGRRHKRQHGNGPQQQRKWPCHPVRRVGFGGAMRLWRRGRCGGGAFLDPPRSTGGNDRRGPALGQAKRRREQVADQNKPDDYQDSPVGQAGEGGFGHSFNRGATKGHFA